MAEKYTKEDFLKDLDSYSKNGQPFNLGYEDNPKTISEKKERVSKGTKSGRREGNSVNSMPEYTIDRLYEEGPNPQSEGSMRTYYENFGGMSKEAIRGYVKGVKETSVERSQNSDRGYPIIHSIERSAYLAAKAGILDKPYVMKDIRESLGALKETGEEGWIKTASKYVKDVLDEYQRKGTVKEDNSRGMTSSDE